MNVDAISRSYKDNRLQYGNFTVWKYLSKNWMNRLHKCKTITQHLLLTKFQMLIQWANRYQQTSILEFIRPKGLQGFFGASFLAQSKPLSGTIFKPSAQNKKNQIKLLAASDLMTLASRTFRNALATPAGDFSRRRGINNSQSRLSTKRPFFETFHNIPDRSLWSPRSLILAKNDGRTALANYSQDKSALFKFFFFSINSRAVSRLSTCWTVLRCVGQW